MSEKKDGYKDGQLSKDPAKGKGNPYPKMGNEGKTKKSKGSDSKRIPDQKPKYGPTGLPLKK